MKNLSKATAAGGLLAALLLGGCAADTSPAGPAAAPSASASGGSVPEQVTPSLPEARGLEATPVIVDPGMDAMPGVAEDVQAALDGFIQASRSFPELQKGSRPEAATDGDILAPLMQPLISEQAWADSVDQIRSGFVPTWYPAGNPAALFSPLDPAEARHLIPDDNGYTFVHAEKTPLTISAAQTGYPGTYVAVDDIIYRAYFTNTLGEAVAVEMDMEYVFTPGADGTWDMWQWFAEPRYFYAGTQAELDALPGI